MGRALENASRKMEAERLRRISSGAKALASSSDCRALIAALLEQVGATDNCGMGQNPFATNALTTAHETGKIATAQALVNLINEHVPHFYTDLLREIEDDNRERIATLAAAADADDRAD